MFFIKRDLRISYSPSDEQGELKKGKNVRKFRDVGLFVVFACVFLRGRGSFFTLLFTLGVTRCIEVTLPVTRISQFIKEGDEILTGERRGVHLFAVTEGIVQGVNICP